MSYVPLTPLDILLAAALLIANGAISWGFRLGLEKSIAIAAARMVVQLALIGVVLKFIFAQILAGMDRCFRAGHGRRCRGRGCLTPASQFRWLAHDGTFYRDVAVHRHRCHRARRRRDHHARSVVRAALCAADPRNGTRQQHDRGRPGARRAGRSGQPRAFGHRGTAGARRTTFRGARRDRCVPRCAQV